jgi:hypothetical protein
VTALAIAGAVVAVFRERHSVGPALDHMGAGNLAIAAACALVGVGATFPIWWQVLVGLDVGLPVGIGARIFFTSQLGKYIPGSVWPVVMQMEAGRRWGAARRTMLTANLLMILIACTSGLLIAAAVLPVYDPSALDHYWWGLIAVPPLVALLHPRALTGFFDLVARVLHRPPMGARLDPRSELRAFGSSLVSWLGQGLETAVLAATVKGWSVSLVALSIGAMALAVSLGVLFIPAPAGAGVRDVVLALVLGSVMPAGQAIAVVIASRVITVAADLVAATVATVALRPGRGGADERTRTSTPLGTRT